MPKTTSFQEFLIDARNSFGTQFSYAEDDYVNMSTKIRITCNIHNLTFLNTPKYHLRGYTSCPECQKDKKESLFLTKAQEVHPNKYIYDLSNYLKHDSKIRIFCKECDKWFIQNGLIHTQGSGCPICAINNSKKDTLYFIEQSNKKHKNKYSYEKTIYTKSSDKVIITCHIHGDFEQTASIHLSGGGCKKCAELNSRMTLEAFIIKSNTKHNYFYDYSNTKLGKNLKQKIRIICPIHGEFIQTASIHLSGKGCPLCGNARLEGYYNTKRAENKKDIWKYQITNLYVLRCHDENEHYYKIGLAKNMTRRFSSKTTMPYEFEVLSVLSNNLYNLVYVEGNLHTLLKETKYQPIKYFAGHTECFSEIPPIEEIEKHIQDVLLSIENNTHRDHLN